MFSGTLRRPTFFLLCLTKNAILAKRFSIIDWRHNCANALSTCGKLRTYLQKLPNPQHYPLFDPFQ
jgi:hypothetical protein